MGKDSKIRRLAGGVARRVERWSDGTGSPAIVNQVAAGRLTYLDHAALRWLASETRRIENGAIPGDLIEMGCALGGSAIVITKHKDPRRRFLCYDVFGLIPPPSERDGAEVHRRFEDIKQGKSAGIGDDEYYGYQTGLIEKVRASFERFGVPPEANAVQFVQGLYQDTLQGDGPVAFAHIDCDWYDSVTVCLERIVPRLSPGGSLIIDDYFCYSGCRTAVWDYFRNRQDGFEFVNGPRLKIVKK